MATSEEGAVKNGEAGALVQRPSASELQKAVCGKTVFPVYTVINYTH